MFKKFVFLILLLSVFVPCSVWPAKREDYVATNWPTYTVETSTYSYIGKQNAKDNWWKISRYISIGTETYTKYAVGKDNFDAYYVGKSTMTYYSLPEANKHPYNIT